MKYINAADLLPERLLEEVQSYVDGAALYIPKSGSGKGWGTCSGSQSFYFHRNQEIKRLFPEGVGVAELSGRYGLSENTIKKIIYR